MNLLRSEYIWSHQLSASANAGTCSAASTDLVRCIRLLTVYLNCASYDGRSGIESNWAKSLDLADYFAIQLAPRTILC